MNRLQLGFGPLSKQLYIADLDVQWGAAGKALQLSLNASEHNVLDALDFACIVTLTPVLVLLRVFADDELAALVLTALAFIEGDVRVQQRGLPQEFWAAALQLIAQVVNARQGRACALSKCMQHLGIRLGFKSKRCLSVDQKSVAVALKNKWQLWHRCLTYGGCADPASEGLAKAGCMHWGEAWKNHTCLLANDDKSLLHVSYYIEK